MDGVLCWGSLIVGLSVLGVNGWMSGYLRFPAAYLVVNSTVEKSVSIETREAKSARIIILNRATNP